MFDNAIYRTGKTAIAVSLDRVGLQEYPKLEAIKCI